MVESWGSGYRRVVEACLSGGYSEPEWLEMGSAFRVVFRPYVEPVQQSEASDVPVNVPVNVPRKCPCKSTTGMAD
jgi:predicted HTH transcriptional regulator